jgi:large subunit ribosomal protein L29
MSIREIREKDSPDLADLLDAKRKELFNLRLSWSTGSLENANPMRDVRKDIARILTVLRERELAAAYVQEHQHEQQHEQRQEQQQERQEQPED